MSHTTHDAIVCRKITIPLLSIVPNKIPKGLLGYDNDGNIIPIANREPIDDVVDAIRCSYISPSVVNSTVYTMGTCDGDTISTSGYDTTQTPVLITPITLYNITYDFDETNIQVIPSIAVPELDVLIHGIVPDEGTAYTIKLIVTGKCLKNTYLYVNTPVVSGGIGVDVSSTLDISEQAYSIEQSFLVTSVGSNVIAKPIGSTISSTTIDKQYVADTIASPLSPGIDDVVRANIANDDNMILFKPYIDVLVSNTNVLFVLHGALPSSKIVSIISTYTSLYV